MVSSTAASTEPEGADDLGRLPPSRLRYLCIARPNGAHAWHGPFGDREHDGGRALLGWLRLWATLRHPDGTPLVPHDAVWSVTRTTTPLEAP